jgi:alpha-glucosidase
MPANFTFLHTCLLLWTSLLHWGSAVSPKRADSCSGYKASNVQRSESSLTADLTLVGTPCNIHGEDLLDLKFSAHWQTGMSLVIRFSIYNEYALIKHRFSTARHHI